MESRVWRWLEKRYGALREDPASWADAAAAVYGLQGMKREAVFDAIGSAALGGALDAIVGAGRWTVPSRVWHTDFDFRGPADPPSGALVFSFLSDVPDGAGGTLVVAGSHRLIARFVAARPSAGREKMKVTRTSFLTSEPWLRELTREEPAEDRAERLMQPSLVAGVPVRVVELTGEAGDVVIGHPWLLHAGAPNCGAAPRIMRVQRVRLAAPGVSVASVM